MEEACIFMMIFGAALLLAALRLCLAKDPRKSVLLAKVQGVEKMPLSKARKLAFEIGAAVGGVGLALVIYCAFRLRLG